VVHSFALLRITFGSQKVPKTQLTELAIRSLKPGTYYDVSTPAFGIRVGKHRKTWIVMRGRTRTRTRIGFYPATPLAEARRKAFVLLGSHLHPRPSTPFHEALEQFLEIHGQSLKPRSKRELERTLRRHFPFGRTALDKITHGDISSIIDGLMDTPSEACHAFKDIRTFFRWCVPRYLPHSPCEGLKMPARYVPRQRVLNEAELKQVWEAVAKLAFPFHPIVKLMILTGARKTEVGTLRFPFIDEKERTITLPETKNGRPHTFPYGGMTAKILEDTPRLNSTTYLFPGRNPEQPYNGWSKHKTELDELSGVTDWTLHDLRRTYATAHASMGTAPHIIERLLNHVSGTISGVAAIYNRFQYVDEMRAAVNSWEERLAAVVR
jgi:integrase